MAQKFGSGDVSYQDSPRSSSPPPTLKKGGPGVTIKKASYDQLGLGAPYTENKFWWQRKHRNYDENAIATQISVFDDPETAPHYQPREDWENLHRFDPSARWTWGEEYGILRKIDLSIMIFACVMFFALELDRANLSMEIKYLAMHGQALTDNFLNDLNLTTNDYNLGNTVFYASFLCAELPSQLVSKWIGPDRWIPTQMVLWSIVACSQFWLSGRTSFLVTRSLLAILQGGFIPDMILYLSYFYKHGELALRLSFWWTSDSVADIVAAFLGAAILNLRGHGGYAGWRWLFLIEGLITLVVGIAAYALMPPSPTQTANWIRGKGWFTEREEIIMVNRVIREDPSKSTMHNRQPITPRLLWQSLNDYDLWPLYIIGLVFFIPYTPPNKYLTLVLKSLGFGTIKTNLLVIPSTVLNVITMIGITYVAEITQQFSFWGFIGQVWALPFLIYLYKVDIYDISPWVAWLIISLLLSYPSCHAIQVGWCSRNSNSVRSRTVSAAMYNMCCQAGSIISSNIYRDDDSPLYRRGNRALIGVTAMNLAIYTLTKVYFVLRNRHRDRIWNTMTLEEQAHYLRTTTDVGNKRLDFRFGS